MNIPSSQYYCSRMLVKIVAFDGKHKLADKWEEEVYYITITARLYISYYIALSSQNICVIPPTQTQNQH